jgi:hypothetical protein
VDDGGCPYSCGSNAGVLAAAVPAAAAGDRLKKCRREELSQTCRHA